MLKIYSFMQAWFAYFFELPWLWKRQKNALRILLCIPGRNNVLLLFRGTTRIEKNNTTKHSWSVSFPTQARNVCDPYRPTEIHWSMIFAFNLSAPECSLPLLRQTALSVGDAVFLSVSEDKSLLLRIYSWFCILAQRFSLCKS